MFEEMMRALFAPILQKMDDILAEVRATRKMVSRWTIPVPGLVSFTLNREEDSMLVYTAVLPTLPSPIGDIVKQHFSVKVGGVAVLETTYPVDGSVVESEEFKVNDNDEVAMSLAYEDDAGNVGSASLQTFTAKDTIPPDAPGPFGQVTLVREEA